MNGETVSEDTAGEVFEEKQVEFDLQVGDDSNEFLIFLATEDGANANPPATPLGKKVVTEGREEGPNEGEVWRLVMSRKRQFLVASEAREARLRTLVE